MKFKYRNCLVELVHLRTWHYKITDTVKGIVVTERTSPFDEPLAEVAESMREIIDDYLANPLDDEAMCATCLARKVVA